MLVPLLRRPVSAALVVLHRVGGLVGLIALIGCFINLANVHAQNTGEQAEFFLKRLESENHFDAAIQYLDRIDEYPGVPQEFLDSVLLKKGTIYILQGQQSGTLTRQNDIIVKGENAFKEFLKTHPNHPETPIAKMRIGALQLLRGHLIQKKRKPSAEDRIAARELFLAAKQTFADAHKNLVPKLKALRVKHNSKPKGTGRTSLHKRYNMLYRQLVLQESDACRQAAQTYDDPVKEYGDDIKQMAVKVKEHANRMRRNSTGAEALLECGQLHKLLGQYKEAISSYKGILAKVDSPETALIKWRAATALIDNLLSQTPPLIDAAIKETEPLVNIKDPKLRRLKKQKEYQGLRLQLAKAYIAKSESIKKAKGPEPDQKKAIGKAVKLLSLAARIRSPHKKEARKLLAVYGKDATSLMPTSMKFKSFAEMLDKVDGLHDILNDKLEALETNDALSQVEGADVDALKNERLGIESEIKEISDQAIAILTSHMAMVRLDSQLDPNRVTKVRKFLAFFLAKSGKNRHAAVVGSFMAQVDPGGSDGQFGGSIATNSLCKALFALPESAAPAERIFLLDQTNNLVLQIKKYWPNSPTVVRTQGYLLQVAIKAKQFDAVTALANELPDGSPEKNAASRFIGFSTWNQYVKLNPKERKEQGPNLLAKVSKNLSACLQSKTADAASLITSLTLARATLAQGQLPETLKVLDHEQHGPLKLLDKADQGPDRKAFDAYDMALQAAVPQLSDPQINSKALWKRIDQWCEKLQLAAGDDAAAKQKIVNRYKKCTKNILEQLKDAPANKHPDLMTAAQAFLSKITQRSSDEKILLWSVQNLVQMSEVATADSQKPPKGPIAKLLKTTSASIHKLIGQAKDPKRTNQLRHQLGQIYRLQGDYGKAIDEFKKILKKNQMLLQVQKDAAMTYEQWAKADKKRAGKLYHMAWAGTAPNKKTKKNIVFGWNKISRITKGKPNHRDTFFNAQYRYAYCRFLEGKITNTPKNIRGALSDIKILQQFNPKLGNPETKKEFDRLLRSIQKELKIPVTGFAKS